MNEQETENTDAGSLPARESRPQKSEPTVSPVGSNHWLGRLSVARKLATGFTFGVIALLTIATTGYQRIAETLEAQNWVTHTHKVLSEARNILSLLTDAETGQRGFLLTGQEKYLAPYNGSVAILGERLAALKQLTIDNPQQTSRLESIKPLLKGRLEELQKGIELRRSVSFEAALAQLQEERGKKFMEDLRVSFEEIEQSQQNLLTLRKKELEETVESTNYLIIFGTIFSVCALIFIAFLISRSITLPLNTVMEALSAGAKGDLRQDVVIRSQDELGQLGTHFNTMRRNVSDIVTRIQKASLQITSAANEVSANASQNASITNQQAQQVNEITSTLKELSSTLSRLATDTGQVLSLAEESSREVEEGSKLVEESSQKSVKMQKSQEETAFKLKDLADNIEGIGKILTTISNVSDQTNLLSLNASIEAAKAGEQGKGFNVVAQEIRRLADQTGLSSKEISDLISKIQGTSSSAIMGLEKSTQDVRVGIETTNKMGDRFKNVSVRFREVSPKLQSLASAINEHSRANQEVTNGFTQMNEGIRTTADSAKQMTRSANQLNSMAQDLRSAMSQFRVA